MDATGNLTIRAAAEADLPAIVGIYNWAVNQTFSTLDAEPLSKEEAADWWTTHARRSVVIVAEDPDDGVIGWARLLPWARRGLTATVENLVYVDPLHHGKGIGRQLIERLAEEARGLGYRTMVAQVAADNEAGMRLHKAAGFRQVGTIHQAAHKFNRWMDITLMEKQLSA
jgi:phosphinothricin acetyltransferase